jgi:hypothetical protein
MDILKLKKVSNFTLDARVDKKIWKDAPEIVLVDSVSGKQVEKRTIVKSVWSKKGLYLLFVVDDDHIWGTYRKNDDPIYNEEVVEVFLGVGEKTPTEYFEFQFSPNNVKFDAKIANPTGNRSDSSFRVDISWDAPNLKFIQKIENRLPVDKKCVKGTWITEVFVSWPDLGWRVKSGEKLRANFFRIDGYPEQSSFQAWQPTFEDPPNFHVPEKFGLLELI